MRYAITRGEKTVRELAVRLYALPGGASLDAAVKRSREDVEKLIRTAADALTRANPAAGAGPFAAGLVLVVPAVDGLDWSGATARSDPPADPFAAAVVAHLAAVEKALKDEQARVRERAAALDKDPLWRPLREFPQFAATKDAVRKAADARADALGRLLKDWKASTEHLTGTGK